MKRVLLPVLALALLLAGCATPETRLRTGLQNAGLSKAMSACMAERMVDRLSLLQLRRLASLGSLKDKHVSDLTLDQFFRKVRALKDPEILTVSTSSAAVCALR
ncbi:hypothetical protein OVY29_19490 [Sphingopyxis sp. SE2]|jgi:hypothetical protein|uniref:hypothetical protein n=1 Tax=unclassified Sphingopyxis TaxID=2614943 RepID=UPI00050E8A4A|nr:MULTISPECIES: hypothetical protein [unclassified Sphingopyxis]KGB58358.1 hypotheticall protein [Sphingopyxis sp. LC363]MDT7530850.1 hypothetical protein [Sphingopyxis sp. SE2]